MVDNLREVSFQNLQSWSKIRKSLFCRLISKRRGFKFHQPHQKVEFLKKLQRIEKPPLLIFFVACGFQRQMRFSLKTIVL